MNSDMPTQHPALSHRSPRFASDRTEFYVDDDIWRFRTSSKAIRLDFARLGEVATPALIAAAKTVVADLAETRNLTTVASLFERLRTLLLKACQRRDHLVDVVEAADVVAWALAGNARYLGQLLMLVEAWDLLKAPGMTWQAMEQARAIHVPPSDDDDAVRTWDPEAGPFRPAEDAVLKTALDAAFNDGTVDLYNYTLSLMFRGLGSRPAQFAAMKVGDFRRKDGAAALRIPLVKQPGVPARGAFMPWKPLTMGLADTLALHIEVNVAARLAPSADLRLAPLFPPKRGPVGAGPGIEDHVTADVLAHHHAKTFRGLSVTSPLTGKVIVVNPRRERHTVLTSLAMNGCTAEEIAANAGHKHPESCRSYVDASIDHFQRMESIVGDAFIPIADRFLGKVVRSERDDVAATNPASILRDRALEAVGSCAVGGCGAVDAGAAPVACYSCWKFRAWEDGPHQELRDLLLEEQALLREAGHAEVAETRTATIVAIDDLLEDIRNRKEKPHG